MREIKSHLKNLEKAKQILNERYRECNTNGHQQLGKDGYCSYCYRSVGRESTEFRTILMYHHHSKIKQPLNEASVRELEKNRLALRRKLDRLQGLSRIINELRISELRGL
jgi:hypothetical protein